MGGKMERGLQSLLTSLEPGGASSTAPLHTHRHLSRLARLLRCSSSRLASCTIPQVKGKGSGRQNKSAEG